MPNEFAYIHEEGKIPESLQDNPFLATFASDDLDDLLHSSNLVEANEGEDIIAEGEDTSRIYILLAGSVAIVKAGKKFIELTKTGEIFGELATIDDKARSATVRATSKTFCLAVDQKFLQDVKPKEDNPAFYAALYEAIARITVSRLKTASDEIARLEEELAEAKAANTTSA